MRKLEILAGVGAGIVAFLTLKGYNLFPWLLLGGLTYFLIASRGHLGDIGRKKVGAVVGRRPDITFGDVGGQAVAKRELMEALQFLRSHDRAMRLGIRPLRGILLSGPPGTGKTLLAKAAANYTDSAFISASGSEFIEVYAGLGAQRVRGLFEKARRLARDQKKKAAIIFIEEIEVLAGKIGAQVGTWSTIRRSTSSWSRWTDSGWTTMCASWLSGPPTGLTCWTRRSSALGASTGWSGWTFPIRMGGWRS